MDNRVLLFLSLVGSFWCCNARDLIANRFIGISEIHTVLESNYRLTDRKAQDVERVEKNENLCVLCEQFATEALEYLKQNKTQIEIVSALQKSCSKIPSFKQQVSSIEAEGFCRKVDLCEHSGSFSTLVLKDNKCDVCHNIISEALEKLNDPDTQLEIVQMLLKACNSIGKNVQKCKRLVFEYAPIILANAQQFLETNDICTILHACDTSAAHVLRETEVPMHPVS